MCGLSQAYPRFGGLCYYASGWRLKGWAVLDITPPKGKNRPWTCRGKNSNSVGQRSFSYVVDIGLEVVRLRVSLCVSWLWMSLPCFLMFLLSVHRPAMSLWFLKPLWLKDRAAFTGRAFSPRPCRKLCSALSGELLFLVLAFRLEKASLSLLLLGRGPSSLNEGRIVAGDGSKDLYSDVD